MSNNGVKNPRQNLLYTNDALIKQPPSHTIVPTASHHEKNSMTSALMIQTHPWVNQPKETTKSLRIADQG